MSTNIDDTGEHSNIICQSNGICEIDHKKKKEIDLKSKGNDSTVICFEFELEGKEDTIDDRAKDTMECSPYETISTKEKEEEAKEAIESNELQIFYPSIKDNNSSSCNYNNTNKKNADIETINIVVDSALHLGHDSQVSEQQPVSDLHNVVIDKENEDLIEQMIMVIKSFELKGGTIEEIENEMKRQGKNVNGKAINGLFKLSKSARFMVEKYDHSSGLLRRRKKATGKQQQNNNNNQWKDQQKPIIRLCPRDYKQPTIFFDSSLWGNSLISYSTLVLENLNICWMCGNENLPWKLIGGGYECNILSALLKGALPLCICEICYRMMFYPALDAIRDELTAVGYGVLPELVSSTDDNAENDTAIDDSDDDVHMQTKELSKIEMEFEWIFNIDIKWKYKILSCVASFGIKGGTQGQVKKRLMDSDIIWKDIEKDSNLLFDILFYFSTSITNPELLCRYEVHKSGTVDVYYIAVQYHEGLEEIYSMNRMENFRLKKEISMDIFIDEGVAIENNINNNDNIGVGDMITQIYIDGENLGCIDNRVGKILIFHQKEKALDEITPSTEFVLYIPEKGLNDKRTQLLFDIDTGKILQKKDNYDHDDDVTSEIQQISHQKSISDSNSYYIVTRKYTDFEWLRNELILFTPQSQRYIVPYLPKFFADHGDGVTSMSNVIYSLSKLIDTACKNPLLAKCRALHAFLKEGLFEKNKGFYNADKIYILTQENEQFHYDIDNDKGWNIPADMNFSQMLSSPTKQTMSSNSSGRLSKRNAAYKVEFYQKQSENHLLNECVFQMHHFCQLNKYLRMKKFKLSESFMHFKSMEKEGLVRFLFLRFSGTSIIESKAQLKLFGTFHDSLRASARMQGIFAERIEALPLLRLSELVYTLHDFRKWKLNLIENDDTSTLVSDIYHQTEMHVMEIKQKHVIDSLIDFSIIQSDHARSMANFWESTLDSLQSMMDTSVILENQVDLNVSISSTPNFSKKRKKFERIE